MSNVEPIYVGRRQKFKHAIILFILGVLAWQMSHLAGRVLLGGSFLLFGRAILRGRERIV